MYVLSYLQRVVSVNIGYYLVRYIVRTEGSKCIYMILSGTLFRTYRGVLGIYVGYYHVRYFVLTEGSKCICRILSGMLFRTYRR